MEETSSGGLLYLKDLKDLKCCLVVNVIVIDETGE